MEPIVCPHCGKKLELSKALTLQIEKEVIEKERRRHKLELNAAKKEVVLT